MHACSTGNKNRPIWKHSDDAVTAYFEEVWEPLPQARRRVDTQHLRGYTQYCGGGGRSLIGSTNLTIIIKLFPHHKRRFSGSLLNAAADEKQCTVVIHAQPAADSKALERSLAAMLPHTSFGNS